MNRKLAVSVLATGLFLTGMGTAFATTSGERTTTEARASWKNIPTLTSSGVKFYEGQYKWEPSNTNRGAFHWRGKLKDATSTDGHNVYMQVKVEGYSWNRFNGKQKKTVYLDKLVYDGAALHTDKAWIRACRDRGSFHPDNCSSTKYYERP